MHRSVARVAGALPNAQARVADEVQHAWALEDPDLFTHTVRAWLTGVPLPDRLLPVRQTMLAKVAS